MCDCIEKLNNKLEPHNTAVSVSMDLFGGGPDKAVVATVKADDSKRGRPKALIASYCPFCGTKYDDTPSDVVQPRAEPTA